MHQMQGPPHVVHQLVSAMQSVQRLAYDTDGHRNGKCDANRPGILEQGMQRHPFHELHDQRKLAGLLQDV